MKFLAAFALIAVVASASVQRFTPAQQAELQEIVDAIYSPSTHPATAAALEQMLGSLLDVANIANPAIVPTPVLGPGVDIIAGPALVPAPAVNPLPSPVVNPAVNPVPNPIVNPAVSPVPTPVVSPVPIIAPQPEPAVAQSESSVPLVQIILNINQADGSVTSAVSPAVAVAGAAAEIPLTHPVNFVDNNVEEIVPTPVNIVGVSDIKPTPVNVVEVPTFEPIAVGPAILPNPAIVPSPVNIVDIPTFEPIAIGPAILPSPAIIPTPVVNLPGILN